MNTYRNLENFESWLKNILNDKCLDLFNLNVYLNDLDEQYSSNGFSSYELNHRYTKSGNPECFDYEVEDVFDDDGEFIERVYIF